MSYVTGSVAAVPTDRKAAYLDHARRAWPIFRGHGATRMVETWGEDVSPGERTDFYRATQAKDGESIVFSWITWPDRATADAAWAAMQSDPSIGERMGEMPFDGKRMIWGGFAPVFEAGGRGEGVGAYSGFLVPVPAANRDRYIAAARQGWEMLQPLGALDHVEAWGEDVPHGRLTDMYRATEAEAGEVIVFSWIGWPDEATASRAGEAMSNDPAMAEMDMPFDGGRMIFGAFAPILDERA